MYVVSKRGLALVCTNENLSLSNKDSYIEKIFFNLILTAVGVFLLNNLLLFNINVLYSSGKIALICICIIICTYYIWKLSSNFCYGISLSFLGIFLIPILKSDIYELFIYFLLIYSSIHFLLTTNWPIFIREIPGALVSTITICGIKHIPTTFDMSDRLLSGYINKDTLFHVSISAMLKNYNEASTGLHGLVTVPYHTFSHSLYAGISALANVSSLDTYGAATWILFCPLLISSILFASLCFFKKNEIFDVKLVLSCTCLILTVYPLFFYSTAAVWNQFFTSESYLVSLVLLLISLNFLYQKSFSLLSIFVITLLTWEMSLSKASVGLIYTILWGLKVITELPRKNKRFLVYGAIFLILFMVTYLTTINSANAVSNVIKILPLHFIYSEGIFSSSIANFINEIKNLKFTNLNQVLISLFSISFFIFFHFFFTWALIIYKIKWDFNRRLNPKMLLYTIGSGLAGLAIIITFYIPGGSAFYFSNVSFFVALPISLYLLFFIFSHYSGIKNYFFYSSIFIILISSLNSFYLASFLNPLRAIQPQRSSAQICVAKSLLSIQKSTPLNIIIEPNSYFLENNPITQFNAQPFLFPAISERPWLNVIYNPANKDRFAPYSVYKHYGYEQYGLSESTQNVTIEPLIPHGMRPTTLESIHINCN